MSRTQRIVRWTVGVLAALFVVIQLVPYGRGHDNPPVRSEPAWNAPRTRELFYRTCGNCHSHETRWPWYSWVAPASWLVQSDVDDARADLDVSDWDRPHQEGRRASRMLDTGKMPPWQYLIAHPKSRLSPAEKDELVKGLVATFGVEEPRKGAPPAGPGAEED